MSLSLATQPSEKLTKPSRLIQRRAATNKPPGTATKPRRKQLRLTSLAMPLLLRHRLLLLLLLFVAASHGDPAGDNYNTSMCLLQSYTCGNVTISYPFYLAKEIGVINRYNNSYCGYPGLGILCEDDKPILQLNVADKYTITDINYGSGANVSLADSEVLDSSSRCPRVDHNVTLPQNSWFSFPDSTVDYLVFFLGCTFTPYLFQPPTIGEITCGNFYTGAGLSFVLPKRDVPSGNWSQACDRVIEVPVLKYDDPIDPNGSAWRSGEFGKFLRRGFQLAWDKTPGPCNRCERSNGRCSHNQTGQFMGCLCPNGRVDDRDCSAGYFNKRRKTCKKYISPP